MPRLNTTERAALLVADLPSLEKLPEALRKTLPELDKAASKIESRAVTAARAAHKRNSAAWSPDKLAYSDRFENLFEDVEGPTTPIGRIIRLSVLLGLMNRRKRGILNEAA
jgi:hypothetical protein